MLFNFLIRKTVISSIFLGAAVASSFAFAQHSSIGMNQDRAVGYDVIDSPASSQSEPARYSVRDLTHDEGNSTDYSPSSSRSDRIDNDKPDRRENRRYDASNLHPDEGNSLEW